MIKVYATFDLRDDKHISFFLNHHKNKIFHIIIINAKNYLSVCHTFTSKPLKRSGLKILKGPGSNIGYIFFFKN